MRPKGEESPSGTDDLRGMMEACRAGGGSRRAKVGERGRTATILDGIAALQVTYESIVGRGSLAGIFVVQGGPCPGKIATERASRGIVDSKLKGLHRMEERIVT